MVTIPYVCSAYPNKERMFLLQKSADSNVRNTTFPMNQPAFDFKNINFHFKKIILFNINIPV